MNYLMLDLLTTEIQPHEIPQLQNPKVGGLILFSRNFTSRSQIIELVQAIRAIRADILIAVDHEGGRVQRFRDGFSIIPAMGSILPATQGNISQAKIWAKELGFLMAVELLACDIDLSFAPVLDIDGICEIIGNRSFSSDPSQIVALAGAFITGMSEAGMAAVGKHFPGHGNVAEDSHIALPVDARSKEQIFEQDIVPFEKLIKHSALQGIMPAHIVYSQLDPNPAGFSPYWIQTILRKQLGFNGVIFSDDLGMKGATGVGNYQQRAKAALDAGCDMILICNDNEGVKVILDDFEWQPIEKMLSVSLLKPNSEAVIDALGDQSRWEKAKEIAAMILTTE